MGQDPPSNRLDHPSLPTSMRTPSDAEASSSSDFARSQSVASQQIEEPTGIGWRGFALIFGFWTLYGAVMAANLLVSSFRESSPPASLVAFTYLGAYAWAALTLPIFRLTARITEVQPSPARRYATLLGIGLVLSVVVSLILAAFSSYFLRQLLGGTLTGPGGIWEIARYRYLNDLLACLLIIAAGIARDYFLRYQARQAEASVLRVQLAEARLETLRTQLNPHFLFNTLNAISALVGQDPKGVRRMIGLLGDMLRHTLEVAPDPEVTVADELEFLSRYLNILEIRFAGRLQTRIDTTPEAADALVPSLILQPLAENAMKHGVELAGGHGRIDVEARRDGDDLVLTVTDTGSGRADRRHIRGAASLRSGGLGLKHISERLRQLYGTSAGLHLTKGAAGGTAAEVRLPFHTRPAIPRSARVDTAEGPAPDG
ncbi:MAG: histidine kinase [Gemmatimonas sp.]|nr:histidine kinase [Gemmatimonas sp.]